MHLNVIEVIIWSDSCLKFAYFTVKNYTYIVEIN
jgi:hypothetical protein